MTSFLNLFKTTNKTYKDHHKLKKKKGNDYPELSDQDEAENEVIPDLTE